MKKIVASLITIQYSLTMDLL